MVNTTTEWYFFNLFLVFFAFYLFIILISIFGFIFFCLLRKLSKKEWDLHFLEISIISFTIGLSIYISICLILDIFEFFNFYSAYLPIIIIDIVFILFLIYRKNLTIERITKFISRIKKRFANKPRDSILFILIIFIAILIQILVQWRIITQNYTLASRDTYSWMGHTWHLLERGYLWRERHSIHYPRGFIFFIVAPILINPDFRFAYLYFKFGGIPMLSLYILIIALIVKRIFKKNYLVLTGLMLTLISNHLISQFIINTSSSIPTLMILISIIIIRSKCPFYLTGFLVQIMFLFNPAFAACYIMVWVLFILIKIFSNEYRVRFLIINYAIKPLILIILLLLTHFIHTFIVLDLTLMEFLNAYGFFFGTINLSEISMSFHLKTIMLNINFSDILKILAPKNDIVDAFRDSENRMFSFFLIFTIIGVFIPTRKFYKKKFSDIIIFGKLSLLIVIGLYMSEILFWGTRFIFLIFFYWVKTRAVEAFTGPLIIFCCFVLELIIKKGSFFTSYLKNKYSYYRKLLRNEFLSKLLRVDNILITTLLISIFSTFLVHRDIYYAYYFDDEHIETIYYIKDNVPDDSKILVHSYDGMGDALYSLLSTYDLYDWDFSEGKNDIIAIKQYIKDKNIEYVLLDLEKVSSIELYNFTSDIRFKNIYENDVHMLFEYNDDYLVNAYFSSGDL